MSSQNISFHPPPFMNSNSQQGSLLSINEMDKQESLSDYDFLLEENLKQELPQVEDFIEKTRQELQKKKQYSQSQEIALDVDTSIEGTLVEDVTNLIPEIPSNNCNPLSERYNQNIESHAKRQSSTKETAGDYPPRNSQYSTNCTLNQSFQNDDEEEEEEKQEDIYIDQQIQLPQQQQISQKFKQKQNADTERSRSREKKEIIKANQISVIINLKDITQPFKCICGANYKTSSSLKNHMNYMNAKKDPREHERISRDVCHGRPQNLTDEELNSLEMNYKLSLSLYSSDKEKDDRIRTLTEKFQVKINEKKITLNNNNHVSFVPLMKDNMKLRKLFALLPINEDSDAFIGKYFEDKFEEYGRLEPNQVGNKPKI